MSANDYEHEFVGTPTEPAAPGVESEALKAKVKRAKADLDSLYQAFRGALGSNYRDTVTWALDDLLDAALRSAPGGGGELLGYVEPINVEPFRQGRAQFIQVWPAESENGLPVYIGGAPPSTTLDLAGEALKALDARKDEPVEEWAERLGTDLAAIPSSTATEPAAREGAGTEQRAGTPVEEIGGRFLRHSEVPVGGPGQARVAPPSVWERRWCALADQGLGDHLKDEDGALLARMAEVERAIVAPPSSETDAREWGRKIRKRRVELGLSLRELAHAAILTNVRLGEIEREVDQPTPGEFMAIANVLLGVSAAEVRALLDCAPEPEGVTWVGDIIQDGDETRVVAPEPVAQREPDGDEVDWTPQRLAWRPADDEMFGWDPEGAMICNLCNDDPCCCGVPAYYREQFRRTRDALRKALARPPAPTGDAGDLNERAAAFLSSGVGDRTHAELAEALGTSRPYVTRVLNGRQNITLSTLEKFASVLGLRVDIAPAAPTGDVVATVEVTQHKPTLDHVVSQSDWEASLDSPLTLSEVPTGRYHLIRSEPTATQAAAHPSSTPPTQPKR